MSARTVKAILPFPLASIACLGASFIVAKILLAMYGFGSGDTIGFLYWTSLFAVALLLPALVFTLLVRHARMFHRVWIGVLLGGLAGFGWTIFNLWILGPWFGLWDFSVLYCWIAGGAAGILVVALLGNSRVSSSLNSSNT